MAKSGIYAFGVIYQTKVVYVYQDKIGHVEKGKISIWIRLSIFRVAEYENTEIDFLEDLSNAFGIDRASKFRYANFYYDIDKIKDLSEEELDEKLKNIVR